MESKVDLKNLKSEIDNRKTRKREEAIKLGEEGKAPMPADQFLKGLLKARETGVPNKSTNTLKLIENKLDVKDGITPTRVLDDVELLEHVDTGRSVLPPRQAPQRQQHPSQEYADREEALYAEFTRKQNELYKNYPEIYKKPPLQEGRARSGQPINEELILENAIGYIKENLAPIIEETMKDTIMKMYATEMIKEVISENKEIIEKIVIETIRKIQDQNKKKLQESKK